MSATKHNMKQELYPYNDPVTRQRGHRIDIKITFHKTIPFPKVSQKAEIVDHLEVVLAAVAQAYKLLNKQCKITMKIMSITDHELF